VRTDTIILALSKSPHIILNAWRFCKTLTLIHKLYVCRRWKRHLGNNINAPLITGYLMNP